VSWLLKGPAKPSCIAEVMTYDALVADVHFLIELGANFVRGAHYAQDQRFLDLCDVYGLLVWEDSWCSFGVFWSKCSEAGELEPVCPTALTTVGNTLAKEVLGWQNTVADFANPTFVIQSLRSLARTVQGFNRYSLL